MKMTLTQIQKAANNNDARGFYRWLTTHNVDHVMYDVTLSDPNEEWMNVSVIEVPDVSVDITYVDGVLDAISVNELSEV